MRPRGSAARRGPARDSCDRAAAGLAGDRGRPWATTTPGAAEPTEELPQEEWVSIWAILLVAACIMVAVNILVIALCRVAARSDASLERLSAKWAGKESKPEGSATGRSRARG